MFADECMQFGNLSDAILNFVILLIITLSAALLSMCCATLFHMNPVMWLTYMRYPRDVRFHFSSPYSRTLSDLIES